MKWLLLTGLIVVAAAGCGGGGATTSATGAPAASCPEAWRAGWQRLANDVGASVYCPRWMPKPLDARISGIYRNGRWVDRNDKSYLVSFLWVDHDSGVSQEVHVNFRGYPGRTKIPMCDSTLTANGKTVHTPIPCFGDPRPARRKLGAITATVYTVNQGIDAWHVLYAWKRKGSLYTVSQHVTKPYSYSEVVHNLDRIVRGLVPLRPVT